MPPFCPDHVRDTPYLPWLGDVRLRNAGERPQLIDIETLPPPAD